MSKKSIGFLLIGLGAVGLVVSLAADAIGLGSYPGINGAQLLGAVLSLVAGAVGVWLAQSKADSKK